MLQVYTIIKKICTCTWHCFSFCIPESAWLYTFNLSVKIINNVDFFKTKHKYLAITWVDTYYTYITAVLTICTNLEVMRGLVGRYLQFKKEPDRNKLFTGKYTQSKSLWKEILLICLKSWLFACLINTKNNIWSLDSSRVKFQFARIQ